MVFPRILTYYVTHHWYFSSTIIYIIYVSLIKDWFDWYYYVSFHSIHGNIWYSDRTFSQPLVFDLPITDADYGEYHDLYVQSDSLLLANVFENFRNMCLKIYELDPARFLTAPGLTWQAALKKTEKNRSFN